MLVAIFLPVLIGAGAVAVDLGAAYVSQAQLQTAVDAGALGGAQAVAAGDSASSQATSIVTANYPAAQNITVTTSGESVTVSANAPVAGGLGAIFGIHQFTVGAQGTATGASGSVTPGGGGGGGGGGSGGSGGGGGSSQSPNAAFFYTIFQGDNAAGSALSLNGAQSVAGTVHSNGAIDVDGAWSVSGQCSASTTITVDGAFTCGTESQNTPVVPMPVWTAAELEAAPNVKVIGTESAPVTCSMPDGASENTVLCGSTEYTVPNGTNLVVWGSLSIGTTSYEGAIVTIGGNITITGALSTSGSDDGVTLAAVSPTGAEVGGGPSITLDGAASMTDGILYAPDGTIDLEGAASVVGGVIGYQLEFQGADSVSGSNGTTYSLPVGGGVTTLTS